MPIYLDSDDQAAGPSRSTAFFGRTRPVLYSILGGGRVADILLWRSKTLSAAILAGLTAIWFLFEVVELHFITVACYILMILMLILFIWTQATHFFKWRPPTMCYIQVSDSTGRYMLSGVNKLMAKFYWISCGYDFGQLFLAVMSIWILSIAGSYSTALNVLYAVFLCLITLPVLYERYEREVHYIATQGRGDIKRFYNKLDTKVFSKIPRAPLKHSRFM